MKPSVASPSLARAVRLRSGLKAGDSDLRMAATFFARRASHAAWRRRNESQPFAELRESTVAFSSTSSSSTASTGFAARGRARRSKTFAAAYVFADFMSRFTPVISGRNLCNVASTCVFRARAFRDRHPRIEAAQKDDRSSKNQPKRVEHGRARKSGTSRPFARSGRNVQPGGGSSFADAFVGAR